MPAPSGSEQITGQIRYRLGWFGKLILEVEEVYAAGYAGMGTENPTQVTRTRWRDATVRDLRLIDWHERNARAKAEGTPPPPPPEQYAWLNGRPA